MIATTANVTLVTMAANKSTRNAADGSRAQRLVSS